MTSLRNAEFMKNDLRLAVRIRLGRMAADGARHGHALKVSDRAGDAG